MKTKTKTKTKNKWIIMFGLITFTGGVVAIPVSLQLKSKSYKEHQKQLQKIRQENKKKLEKLSKKNDSSILSKDNKIKELQFQNQNLKKEIEKNREELDKSQTQRSSIQKNIESLQLKINSKKKEINKLNSDKEKLQKEKSELENEKNILDSKSSDLRSQLQTAQTSSGNKDLTIKQLTNDKNELDNRIKTLTSEKNNLDKSASDLRSQLQTAQTSSGNKDLTIKQLTNDKNELDNRIQTLTSEKNNLDKSASDLRGQLEIAKKESSDKGSEIMQLETNENKLNQRINELKGKKLELEKQDEELKKENKDLKSSIDSLKKEQKKLNNLLLNTNKYFYISGGLDNEFFTSEQKALESIKSKKILSNVYVDSEGFLFPDILEHERVLKTDSFKKLEEIKVWENGILTNYEKEKTSSLVYHVNSQKKHNTKEISTIFNKKINKIIISPKNTHETKEYDVQKFKNGKYSLFPSAIKLDSLFSQMSDGDKITVDGQELTFINDYTFNSQSQAGWYNEGMFVSKELSYFSSSEDGSKNKFPQKKFDGILNNDDFKKNFSSIKNLEDWKEYYENLINNLKLKDLYKELKKLKDSIPSLSTKYDNKKFNDISIKNTHKNISRIIKKVDNYTFRAIKNEDSALDLIKQKIKEYILNNFYDSDGVSINPFIEEIMKCLKGAPLISLLPGFDSALHLNQYLDEKTFSEITELSQLWQKPIFDLFINQIDDKSQKNNKIDCIFEKTIKDISNSKGFQSIKTIFYNLVKSNSKFSLKDELIVADAKQKKIEISNIMYEYKDNSKELNIKKGLYSLDKNSLKNMTSQRDIYSKLKNNENIFKISENAYTTQKFSDSITNNIEIDLPLNINQEIDKLGLNIGDRVIIQTDEDKYVVELQEKTTFSNNFTTLNNENTKHTLDLEKKYLYKYINSNHEDIFFKNKQDLIEYVSIDLKLTQKNKGYYKLINGRKKYFENSGIQLKNLKTEDVLKKLKAQDIKINGKIISKSTEKTEKNTP